MHRMESQDEEWKQIWKSECLKHVASMANSSGGVITVGKCDDGNVVGVQNPEKLLKEIPDIVQNKLGFVPVVRPICIDGKTCIEIVVERRDTLVDLDGKFYRRSGSTTHQMVGRELRKALLAEINTSWTDLPIDSVGIDALSPDAVKYFLDAGKKNGMLSESLDGSGVRFVLEHFGMICPDGKITISAALLFLPKPQSAVEGAYAKIGQFSEGGEILREDIIHAPVVMQPDLIMDKLYDKYIPGTYEYEKVQRVTVYRYPHDALREAIVNSLSHKDYWSAEPVTIRVYPNKVTIFNFGELPDDWTVDNLIGEHSSVRRNHKIADVFFEAGYIERWGKGIQKICDACRASGNPLPTFVQRHGGLAVTFEPNRLIDAVKTVAVNVSLTPSERKVYLLICKNNDITRGEIAESMGLGTRRITNILSSLREKNAIVRVGSKKAGSWMTNDIKQ